MLRPECTRDFRVRLDPNQTRNFTPQKAGMPVDGILQLCILVHLLMIRRESHKSPSTELLLKGTVCQVIKVLRENGIHKSRWIMNGKLLPVGRPRYNRLFPFLFSMTEQSMKTTKKLAVMFHPIGDLREKREINEYKR